MAEDALLYEAENKANCMLQVHLQLKDIHSKDSVLSNPFSSRQGCLLSLPGSTLKGKGIVCLGVCVYVCGLVIPTLWEHKSVHTIWGPTFLLGQKQLPILRIVG